MSEYIRRGRSSNSVDASMIRATAAPEGQGALRERLQRAYCEHLTVPAGTETQLAAALRETLRRPGNLIRAELSVQVAAAYGLEDSAGEQLAIALEYFHTASLLFDDLPSMDDAVHRRGAVCLHQLYGEGTAILAALTLINRAYSMVWSSMQDLTAANRRFASAYVEQQLGLNGILNGQSRDLHFADADESSSSAQQIALEKTASLIRLPIVLPAIMGGASATECNLLDRLAKFWGLAYQALDDLKDIQREEQQTGKTAGRDQALHRPNAALELGTEATVTRLHRLDRLAERTVQRLTGLNPALHFFHQVSERFDADTRETLQRSRETLPRSQGAACCF